MTPQPLMRYAAGPCKRAELLHVDRAHESRVTSMGELATSIYHELKQPTAAAMTNQNTGLRWRIRDKSNLPEAGGTIEMIAKEGARAADIIDRLQSLHKKSPLPRESLDVNEVVHEMIACCRVRLTCAPFRCALIFPPNFPISRQTACNGSKCS